MTNTSEIPQSLMTTARTPRWWLALPIGTLLIIIIISINALTANGPSINIQFPHGHGLKIGDTLRYRGIIAGEVTDLALDPQQQDVTVQVTLTTDAAFLARAESRFWIVRPTLSLSRINGADTIIGARYIAVAPGAGEKQKQFIGLEEEPPILERKPKALEIICQAQTRGGLRSGAPVLYRQCIVGRVLSVDLASDASAIEARLYIEPEYTSLIRENTVFWNASGFTVSGGIIGGVELSVDSIETVLRGGVSLAVPDEPGKQVRSGERFILHPQADEDWLAWHPSIPIVQEQQIIHPNDIPNVVSVSSTWSVSSFWGTKQHSRQALAVVTEQGLLGLESIMPQIGEKLSMTIDGSTYEKPGLSWEHQGLCLRDVQLSHFPWSLDHLRVPPQIENAYAVIDHKTVLNIPAARLSKQELQWLCELKQVEKRWHGAPVLSQADKKLIGFLSVQSREVHVIPISNKLLLQLVSLRQVNPANKHLYK